MATSKSGALVREIGRIAGILIAMALVGPGFVLAIAFGYRVSGDPAPEAISTALVPAMVIFAAALATVAILLTFRIWPANRPREDLMGVDRRHYAAVAEAQAAAARKRLASLDADAATRKYADRIRSGQWWSDEAIAYDRDPDARITCIHLQPIEGAMREAGIALRPYFTGGVDAACAIDEAALVAGFSLKPPVYYNSHVPGDRPFEPEGAVIVCHEHSSTIAVVHPHDAKRDTPRFP
jgi:hypothetical protein